MHYSYLQDDLDKLYASERMQSQLVIASGIASLLISLIGLMGVLNQLILRKTKALNIKKVLGASRAVLLSFTSKELVWLFGVAGITAISAAYYFSDLWLSTFVYRVSNTIWPLFGMAAFIFTLLFGMALVRIVRVIKERLVVFLREE